MEVSLLTAAGSLAGTALLTLAALWVCLRCARMAREYATAREEYERLVARLPRAIHFQQLEQRIQEKETQLEELSTALGEARVTIAERDRAEAQVGALRQELSDVRRELAALDAERAEQERLRLELERDQTALASTREELRQSRQVADDLAFQRARVEREVAALREDLAVAETRRDELAEEVAQVQRERTIAESLLAQVKEQLVVQRQEQEAAETELARLRQAIEAAEARVQELAVEAAQQQASVQTLQAEERGLQESIATLRAMQEQTLETLRQSGQLNDDSDRELWAPVLTSRANVPPAAERELDMLRRLEEHMEACGLEFPRRTLHAFHTSMKVAEMSPLVVLAGISGTGKSELPRRYAEAMGMHFLNVPVQPRWDSPQDMFGFYNYLENRYRPTELTRALIQMDPLVGEEERGWRVPEGWHSHDDELLVVLLDEMNLARVEYYFSDLLSKLETRRGIDKYDRDQREKAELLLEIGRRQGGEASLMRLFVDTNVLFVGTMNEDESTQTLSDKVMDRANVLRFGRPSRLHSRSPSQPLSPVRLSYDVWRSWVRNEEELPQRDPQGRVDEWIHRLNEAMARIGKPFAHRTHQAVRAYVANYPAIGPEALRFAVADQIEQRILPKFRGLDPSEPAMGAALDEVVQLVGELEDDALRRSIEAARSGYAHQFEWRGVERAEVLETA